VTRHHSSVIRRFLKRLEGFGYYKFKGGRWIQRCQLLCRQGESKVAGTVVVITDRQWLDSNGWDDLLEPPRAE
jgi:hypothetical protein